MKGEDTGHLHAILSREGPFEQRWQTYFTGADDNTIDCCLEAHAMSKSFDCRKILARHRRLRTGGTEKQPPLHLAASWKACQQRRQPSWWAWAWSSSAMLCEIPTRKSGIPLPGLLVGPAPPCLYCHAIFKGHARCFSHVPQARSELKQYILSVCKVVLPSTHSCSQA